jgi:hypothetical protein
LAGMSALLLSSFWQDAVISSKAQDAESSDKRIFIQSDF